VDFVLMTHFYRAAICLSDVSAANLLFGCYANDALR